MCTLFITTAQFSCTLAYFLIATPTELQSNFCIFSFFITHVFPKITHKECFIYLCFMQTQEIIFVWSQHKMDENICYGFSIVVFEKLSTWQPYFKKLHGPLILDMPFVVIREWIVLVKCINLTHCEGVDSLHHSNLHQR